GGGRALEGTVGDLRWPTPSAPRPAVIVSLTPGTMWMIGHAIRTVRATKACPLAEAGWSEARHGRLLHNSGQRPYNGGQLLHNSGQLLPDCDAYACPRRVWALCRSAGDRRVTLGAAIDYSRLPTIGRRGIPALSVIATVRPGITQWGRTRPVRGHARRPF